jgi:hypothetical protein
MTFGGAPCPSLWGYISETMADISNVLIKNKYWDPNIVFDPISKSIPPPLSLPEDIPFHSAKELAVPLPVDDEGKTDVYLDDTIGIAPDIENHVTRVSYAIPLAIHTLARPTNDNDIIPRKDIISIKKLMAEGQMSETKIVLGWLINTRTLSISLPLDKHKKWSKDIKDLLSSKRIKQKHLEVLIGRLDHTATVIPMLRHFLSRLRHALIRSTKHGWTSLSITEKTDLHLTISFLDMARDGISINNIVYRKPTKIYRSDASEFGLGGYNITSGEAWRFEIPIDCRLRTSLNSLEFIACMITIWVDILNNKIIQEDCILSQTDSTTANGWLRKSNFSESDDEVAQLTTARQLAKLVMNSRSCLYSQWFAGGENVVSDALSRDFHLSDSSLTHLIISNISYQVPFGLKICQLPQEIISWLTCLLRNLPFKEQWSKEPTQSKLSRGHDIKPTFPQSDCHMTGSSIPSHTIKNIGYSVHSLTHSEKIDLVLQKIIPPLNQSLLEPPWIMWHRPTSWLSEQTQDSTQTRELRSFYNDNLGDTM